MAEAEAIADAQPELIWLEVADEDYYGEPKNMTPGSEDRAPTGGVGPASGRTSFCQARMRTFPGHPCEAKRPEVRQVDWELAG